MKSRGLTLVELLVGVLIGLLIVAGASTLLLGQLQDQRALQQRTAARQELRAIGQWLRHELAQSGAWAETGRALAPQSDSRPLRNPYDELVIGDDSNTLRFAASQAAVEGGGENHVLDDADLKALRLRAGVLEYRSDGGSYQPLNDPLSLQVQQLQLRLVTQTQSDEALCPQPCDGHADCPPRVLVRRLHVEIVAAHPARAEQTQRLRLSPRLADRLEGSCRP